MLAHQSVAPIQQARSLSYFQVVLRSHDRQGDGSRRCTHWFGSPREHEEISSGPWDNHVFGVHTGG
jgi:hypothetical protein